MPSGSPAHGPAGQDDNARAVTIGQPDPILDPHTIALVQQSWARVMPIADAASALFYDRLFQLDPALRALFKSDMREQKKKLMQTLGVAVDGLNNPTRLIPVLEGLGARHAGYMVEARHYDLVGESLLWTLREGLGDDFTDDIEAAWIQVYGLVADVMQKGAAAQEEAPAPRPAAPSTAAHSLRGRASPPAASPPAASPSFEDAATMHHIRAPADPANLAIPLGAARGPDGTINVHLTLEQRPGPAPAATRPSGLLMALLLAALCGAIMLVAASALSTSTVSATAQSAIPADLLYILPLSTMAVAGASFLMGHHWGARGTPSDSAKQPPR